MLRTDDLEEILKQAQEVADEIGQELNTAHLLLAVYTVDSHAKMLLEDFMFDEDTVIGKVLELRKRINGFLVEPPEVVKKVKDKIKDLAKGCKDRRANSLHLIVAIVGVKDSLAYAILNRTRGPIRELRTTAMSYITNGLPMRYARADVFVAESNAWRPVIPTPVAVQQMGRTREARGKAADTGETVLGANTGHSKERRAATRSTGVDKPGAEPEPDVVPAKRIDLSPERFPVICEIGRDLTEAAQQGELDPLIGRAREVQEICDVLGKRRANNPLLLGPPGVGKTALVEGLAWKQVNEPQDVRLIADKRIVAVDLAYLLSPSSTRGGIVERLKFLRQEMKDANGGIILFLDEIHQLSSLARAGGDPAADLKMGLARGEFPCIGATTDEEYNELIESDPALKRRFHPVFVSEPSVSESVEILKGVISSYEQHHGVEYDDEALEASVKLSARYVPDRVLPDKAVHIADLAASRARRFGRQRVTAKDVAELVAGMAGVPAELLSGDDRQRMLDAEEHLSKDVIGHVEVLRRVAAVLRRNYAGFSSGRPIGSFLFLGPTGVGKTETAKALARFLFRTKDALCRFDMSEYGEPHTVARLIGAPPGYVGYGEGGQLTEAVRRRPYSVVLLDEIEKAHPDVLLILLQALEDGRLTDGRGRTVDLSNTVVIMTSNLGASYYSSHAKSIGFAAGSGGPAFEGAMEEQVIQAAKAHFPIELWNRIDEKCVFKPLTAKDVKQIANLIIERSSHGLKKETGVGYKATDAATDLLIEKGGYDPELGARPMRRMVQKELESRVAHMILSKEVQAPASVLIDARAGELVFTIIEE